jgi:hypothetical protein
MKIRPGDIYEDCSYHPCLCVGATEHEVWGVSLIDGSQPRSCDIQNCDVRLLSVDEAWQIKVSGPSDPATIASIPTTSRWWR